MPSPQAVLFNWIMKATFKSQPIHLIDEKILRRNAEKFALGAIPDDLTLEAVTAPVKGEWHRPKNADPGRSILYLHGGGYVFGSPKSHRDMTFALARETAAEVFSLDYRMASEHPFPAAVDDALDAYRWLLGQGRDPAQMVVAGDSAGGGLALALMLSIKARGLAMPAAAVLLSPWTDLAATGASLDRNEKSDAAGVAPLWRPCRSSADADFRQRQRSSARRFGTPEGTSGCRRGQRRTGDRERPHPCLADFSRPFSGGEEIYRAGCGVYS